MLTSASEFSAYQGGTGSYRTQDVINALLLAENQVATWLNSAVEPTTITDEVPWPVTDGKIMLKKQRLISVQSVTALHNLSCTCAWETVSDCAVVLDSEQGIIEVVHCGGPSNICWPCGVCPQRVQIAYTYGFTVAQSDATTPEGMTLRAAIFMAALGYLRSGIGWSSQGNQRITSWSSAGYSESRDFGSSDSSGASGFLDPMIGLAKEMLRSLIIKRSFDYRSRKI